MEGFSGRRFSHQSSPFRERSYAAPRGTDIVYIKLIVMGLCERMRGSADRCEEAKITFRVRRVIDQDTNAKADIMSHEFNLGRQKRRRIRSWQRSCRRSTLALIRSGVYLGVFSMGLKLSNVLSTDYVEIRVPHCHPSFKRLDYLRLFSAYFGLLRTENLNEYAASTILFRNRQPIAVPGRAV